MGLKARTAIKAAAKRVAKLRPTPPTPAPPPRPFRPITPDAFAVQIPRIRKERARVYHTNIEPTTKVLLVLPIREKEEIKKVARELGVSMNTVLRLSYKRFLRMPEPPLSPKQMRIWQMGIQRDRKSWREKDRLAMQRALVMEPEEHDRLSTVHLEHKAVEVFATNGYRKTTRMAFEPGKREGTVGNPSGRNGRNPDSRSITESQPDPHLDQRGQSVVAPLAAGPAVATSQKRRLIVKSKQTPP